MAKAQDPTLKPGAGFHPEDAVDFALVLVISCILTLLSLATGVNLFSNVLPRASGLGVFVGEVAGLFVAFLGGAVLGWSYLYRKFRPKAK